MVASWRSKVLQNALIIAECSHSARLLTCIKRYSVLKTNLWSSFWVAASDRFYFTLVTLGFTPSWTSVLQKVLSKAEKESCRYTDGEITRKEYVKIPWATDTSIKPVHMCNVHFFAAQMSIFIRSIVLCRCMDIATSILLRNSGTQRW